MNENIDKIVSICELLSPILFLGGFIAYFLSFIDYAIFFVIMIIAILVTICGLTLYFLNKRNFFDSED